jgi:polysaccharide biosynthesis/export protein
MRSDFLIAVLTVASVGVQSMLVVAVAQESGPGVTAGVGERAMVTKTLGAADGVLSMGLTGERRPLYRLRKSDVVDISFTFAEEFNQSVSVLPDGFVVLKGAGSLYAEGRTVTELGEMVRQAYGAILHDPEVTVTLKDFERPYFVAGGEVTRPGKYDLRTDTTVTEGVALAGGFTGQAKHSQVVLFRRVSNEVVQAHVLDVKQSLKKRNLDEDMYLRPGDFLFVPQSTVSKIRKYIPLPNLGMYLNPAQF